MLERLVRELLDTRPGDAEFAVAKDKLREFLLEQDRYREEHKAEIARCKEIHASDDLEFDENPRVAPGMNGAGIWVQSWTWIEDAGLTEL